MSQLTFKKSYHGEDPSAVQAVRDATRELSSHGRPNLRAVMQKSNTTLKETQVKCIINYSHEQWHQSLASKPDNSNSKPKPKPKSRKSHPGHPNKRKSRSTPFPTSFENEHLFTHELKRVFPSALSESEQKTRFRLFGSAAAGGPPIANLTPDIRFPAPTFFFGAERNWVEYKGYFGHAPGGRNKFLERARERIEKYARELGPGMVVYKEGFEKGFLDGIEGVECFEEDDVVDYLLLRGGRRAPLGEGE